MFCATDINCDIYAHQFIIGFFNRFFFAYCVSKFDIKNRPHSEAVEIISIAELR